LIEVVLAIKNAVDAGTSEPILVFDDATGRALDFDLRGGTADVIARLLQSFATKASDRSPDADVPEEIQSGVRGRGRPKLGVIGREVTLLPRHWEWLATQPGGASVALRKLVDDARRNDSGVQKRRAAQEAAYHVMSAMAGDLAGFEEATRALFANDHTRFAQRIADWPVDVGSYVTGLAFGESPSRGAE